MDAYNLKLNVQTADRVNPLSYESWADTALKVTSPRPLVKNLGSGEKSTCVPLRCHHIVPFSSLILYWNKHIDEGHLDYSKKFLNQLSRKASQYNVKDGPSAIDATIFCKALMEKRLKQEGDGLSPQYLDAFCDIYAYIPGNIFIGPSGAKEEYCRLDDPGNKFEQDAWVITGSSDFKVLYSLNTMINRYLENPTAELASGISSILTIVVQKTEPYALKHDHWHYKKNHYKIFVNNDIAKHVGKSCSIAPSSHDESSKSDSRQHQPVSPKLSKHEPPSIALSKRRHRIRG